MGSQLQALEKTTMKVFALLASVAPAYHKPAPAYHAAPAPYHEEEPKNYQFGYDVHGYDEYGNPNVHSRTEQRDGYNVKGQYRVELPDCRVQIVDYFVDEYKQYHADVKYEGVPCPSLCPSTCLCPCSSCSCTCLCSSTCGS